MTNEKTGDGQGPAMSRELSSGDVLGGEVSSGDVLGGEVSSGDVLGGELSRGEVMGGAGLGGDVLGSVPDLGAILSQLGQVRDAVQAAHHDAATQVVEGSSGGGLVRVYVTGSLDFRSVTIDPSVVDPGDVELLSDLVLAALRDAVEQANVLQAQALGGFDVGNISGLLGG